MLLFDNQDATINGRDYSIQIAKYKTLFIIYVFYLK